MLIPLRADGSSCRYPDPTTTLSTSCHKRPVPHSEYGSAAGSLGYVTELGATSMSDALAGWGTLDPTSVSYDDVQSLGDTVIGNAIRRALAHSSAGAHDPDSANPIAVHDSYL